MLLARLGKGPLLFLLIFCSSCGGSKEGSIDEQPSATAIWPTAAHVAPNTQCKKKEDVASIVVNNLVKVGGGFGFVIGERDGNLLIATPRHIVGDHSSIDIEFCQKSGTTLTAKVHPPYLSQISGLDLAILEIQPPHNFVFRKDVWDFREPKNGEQIWFVGKQEFCWFVPAIPGAINTTSPEASSNVMVLEGLGVKTGTSGAPVITDTGIVGMVTHDDRAIPIGQIKREWEKRWHLPWSLLPSSCGIITETTALSELEMLVAQMSAAWAADNYDSCMTAAKRIIDRYGPYAKPEPVVLPAVFNDIMNKVRENPNRTIYKKKLQENEVDVITQNGPRNEVAYAWYLLAQSLEKRGKAEDAQEIYRCCSLYEDALILDNSARDPFFWSPARGCKARMEGDGICNYEKIERMRREAS